MSKAKGLYEERAKIHEDMKRMIDNSRKFNRDLSENELDILKKGRPGMVYIGTGQYGNLPLTPGAKELLSNYHTLILPTPDLILKIGQNERDYLAIIHITC